MKHGAYYNDNDHRAVAWLKELIKEGMIADGDVDGRDIGQVSSHDLKGYKQVHLCAGVGAWSYACRLAGWDDAREVWTGSFPCQPFSGAGQRKGFADPRHIWPHGYRLIRECRPAIFFGEQVDRGIGCRWLDAVFNDLEREGYACGAAVLPACSVGAPHRRYRAWFVAHANGRYASTEGIQRGGKHGQFAQDCGVMPLGDASPSRSSARKRKTLLKTGRREEGRAVEQSGRPFWADCGWLKCTDGKARPVEPGTFPLAHGAPARVGRLRGYGNAIVPQVAAEFIKATA